MEKNHEVEIGKKTIYYSRDYRYLSRNTALYIIQLVFVLVPLVYIYLSIYSKLSYHVSKFVSGMIQRITGETVEILKTAYFPKFGGIYYVSMEGRSPSWTLAFISFLVTLLLIVLCSRQETDHKPIMIFITIGLCIHLVSSLYFMFFNHKFPYDMNSYSVLYMKQQIITWLMVMVVYWISTSLIINMTRWRIFTFLLLSIFTFVYGVVRYILYMIIISKGSYLFMASLYFTFGILFDFLIMVGVFSVFMYLATKGFQKGGGEKLWKWS